jgi:hypothetical protein
LPTIIDSLFLELGIDTAKFSKDQQTALAKISDFEKRAKKSGKGASDAIKTVGDAFKDLAKDTRVGATGAGIDRLGQKLTQLGRSAQVAGVASGSMVEGLGSLLSPVSLGVAAVSLLGYEMWDLNKKMTATNATIYRQAQLSGMNASNLWDWGEAARTVGANPQEVTGGIAALQTSIMGMGIGAGNATPQLIALARLGVPFNFKSGANVPQLMARVHQMAMAIPLIDGVRNLGALRALTGPVLNDAMFNLATSDQYDPNKLQKQIGQQAPNIADTLKKSLESQAVLGKLGISKDILAETAYGGEQGLMSAVVTLLTSILDGVNQLVGWFVHPIDTAKTVASAVVDAASRIPDDMSDAWGAIKGMVSPTNHAMSGAVQALMGYGVSAMDAEAIVGNLNAESSMDPRARNGEHYGLAQWDKRRQGDFAKRFGYAMDDESKGKYRQSLDQVQFLWEELQTTQKQAAVGMAKAHSLFGKTGAFMRLFEQPGDGSLGKRYGFAQMADASSASARSVVTVTHDTHIDNVNIHTPSADPVAHADAFAHRVGTHPLINASGTVELATRGMTQ